MHIQLATTRRQILAAYQIRYACLCQELGDYTFAQHQKARMCDTDDIPQSLLYVAYLGDKIVGTARLLLRRHQPFIEDSFYQLPALAAHMRLPYQELLLRTALIDRVCILKDYRGHQIFSALYHTICQELQTQACTLLLAAIQQHNAKSAQIFRHYGLQPWGTLQESPHWQGYLYYRVFDYTAQTSTL